MNNQLPEVFLCCVTAFKKSAFTGGIRQVKVEVEHTNHTGRTSQTRAFGSYGLYIIYTGVRAFYWSFSTQK